MTTLFTLTLITIAVAYCSYKHSRLMKEHHYAENSYYQSKMIEQADKYKRTAVALSLIALLILIASLFGLIESKNAKNNGYGYTKTQRYDA